MHNTKEKNAEFEIASCETSIRYLLGEETRNKELIAKHRRQIKLLQEQLTNADLTLERDKYGFFV